MDDSDASTRVLWTDAAYQCFLQTCIEEVAQNGRKGSSLHMESWNRVQKALKDTCSFEVTQRQMKNQYDYLKGKFNAWLYLYRKSGNYYNEETNSFPSLTETQWTEFEQVHKKWKCLRTSKLPFPFLCMDLFVGASAAGEARWTPGARGSRCREEPSSQPESSQSGSSSSAPNLQQLQLEIEDILADSPDDWQQNPTTPHYQSNTHIPTHQTETERGEVSSPQASRPGKRARASKKKLQLEDKIDSALESIIKYNHDKISHLTKEKKGTGTDPLYDACVEKLDAFGWDQSDPLYLTAVGLFCESVSYKRSWLKLNFSNVEGVKGWITTIGRRMGDNIW